MNKNVLSLCAHPDDTEFSCAGTLALLHEKGWKIHSATMTPGDGGTAEYSREEISKIRKAEAAASAKILDGSYYCLECDDIFVMYDRPSLLKAIELVRKVRPTIVFAPSPTDYMIDHVTASKIVQTACFTAGIPNVETKGTEIYEHVPHLYYVDPIENKDIFGKAVKASNMVDITSTIDIKEKMLCCHASQRNWLLKHHGMDEYVISMKRNDARRGKEIDAEFGEGFRQHLGHAFPQDNLLKQILGNLVHEK